jgi:hypothetical protein
MKFDYYNPAQTEEEARERYPECSVFVEVEGGWAAFETHADYEIWANQI